MALSDEKHPSDAPMSVPNLRSFVSRHPQSTLMSKPKWERDSLKADLRAQLFYQNIGYTSRTTLPTLVKLLRTALEGNKCQSSTPRILEFERRKQEAQRLKEEAWQRCTTPGERAMQDLDRVMEHYFLTNGRPDKSKTTEALALYGFANRSQIHIYAERIPGVETTSGGEGPERTICIGWDRSAVWRLAGTISARVFEEKLKKQEDEWEDTMADHRAFVETLGVKKTTTKLSNQATLERCKGSYTVRCDEASRQWDDCDTLTLDIANGPEPGILIAAYDFGFIEGTMLLALDESDLNAYVDNNSNKDRYSTSEDEPLDSSSDQTAPASKKRKAAPEGGPAELRSRGPRKKAKTNRASPNRLFFQLRGRETGEGQIFFDPHKGYLDFADNRFATFKGVGHLPYIGENVPFEGFKLSTDAASKAAPWRNFSEAIWNKERVSRWH